MVSFYCLVQTTDSWFPEMNVSSISSVPSFISLVSSFTLPHVAPNLYDFLSIVRHNRRYLEECLSCLQRPNKIWWHVNNIKPHWFFHVTVTWLNTMMSWHKHQWSLMFLMSSYLIWAPHTWVYQWFDLWIKIWLFW